MVACNAPEVMRAVHQKADVYSDEDSDKESAGEAGLETGPEYVASNLVFLRSYVSRRRRH